MIKLTATATTEPIAFVGNGPELLHVCLDKQLETVIGKALASAESSTQNKDSIMPKEDKAPKTVLDKLVALIKTQNTPGGSSRQAIVKGMKDKFGEVAPPKLKAALKKGNIIKVNDC